MLRLRAARRAARAVRDQPPVRSIWLGRPEVPEFRRLAREAPERPLVAAAQLDGRPVAAAVCLVGPRAVEYLVTTFDPSFAAASPGKLLIGFLTRWAIERGLDFDTRRLAAPYKDRWLAEKRPLVTRTVALTLRGRIPDPGEGCRGPGGSGAA